MVNQPPHWLGKSAGVAPERAADSQHTAEQRGRGGIRAQEARRGRDENAVDHQIVQQDVVSTKPPPHKPWLPSSPNTRRLLTDGDRVIPLVGVWRDERFPDPVEQAKLQRGQ